VQFLPQNFALCFMTQQNLDQSWKKIGGLKAGKSRIILEEPEP
jgi:hypothetical protein